MNQPIEVGTSGFNSIGARYQTQLGVSTSSPIINHCASRDLTSGQQSRQMLRVQAGGQHQPERIKRKCTNMES
ncbi:MAG: hypothetical protein EZS28_030026 [Streblomastix strix]|uniref:Uncharacterized protein n=1 Tax=Streblomastix strix TaxID=222440 RepID=A0A5J4UWB3_9EUKA|nr:MAG: hypothetical protein EZS28_030026 [Streblomastix strix]